MVPGEAGWLSHEKEVGSTCLFYLTIYAWSVTVKVDEENFPIVLVAYGTTTRRILLSSVLWTSLDEKPTGSCADP